MTTGTTTQQPIRSTMAPTECLFHGGFVTLLTGLVWHFFSWPAPSPPFFHTLANTVPLRSTFKIRYEFPTQQTTRIR